MNLKKILVRSPNWIGDQILAYPFFYYLRNGYPNANITVACASWVQAVQFKNLVNHVVVLPRPIRPSLPAKLKAIEKGAELLRDQGPWDLGISLPNSFSSAWLLYRARVAIRRGYRTDGRGFLLNDPLPWSHDSVEHRADAYARLLPKEFYPEHPIAEFWGVPPSNELDTGIPGIEKFFDAERAWPDAEVLEPPTHPYWILAPGATAESRRWPLEKFASLARQIHLDTGWIGIVVGGAAEAPLAMKLSEDSSLRLLDWTGRGAVTWYWKVFQKARFSVCNDSGLAHMASLCGSPVQIVWGAGNPKRTEPIGPGKVRVALNPVECWPCERNQCSQPAGTKLECIKGIEPQEVWKEIQSGIRSN